MADSLLSGCDASQAAFPRFKVVLVDASGQVKDRIGYWFYEAGAQTAANGWNKLSVDERRGMVAEIRPFDSAAESAAVDSAAVDAETNQEEGSEKYDVVLVNNASGKVVLVCASNLRLSEAAERAEFSNRLPAQEKLCTAVVVKGGYRVESVVDQPSPADDDDTDGTDDTDSDANSDDWEPEPKPDKRCIDGVGVFEGDDSYELGLMMDEAWQAAERGDYSQVVTSGMRYALCRYLLSVIQATIDNKIRSAFDIGMVAKGLERFCAQMIDTDDRPIDFFDYQSTDFRIGYGGDIENDYGTVDALSAWLDARLNEGQQVSQREEVSA